MSEKEHAPSLTLEGLERLAELEERAAPGPWEADGRNLYADSYISAHNIKGCVACFVPSEDHEPERCIANVDLVSGLRNNAKELLRLAKKQLEFEAQEAEWDAQESDPAFQQKIRDSLAEEGGTGLRHEAKDVELEAVEALLPEGLKRPFKPEDVYIHSVVDDVIYLAVNEWDGMDGEYAKVQGVKVPALLAQAVQRLHEAKDVELREAAQRLLASIKNDSVYQIKPLRQHDYDFEQYKKVGVPLLDALRKALEGMEEGK